MATFYQPTRGLRVFLAGAWKRYWCGRRFGHFPVEDSFAYRICSRCKCPLL